jgi:hypothetical protein
LSNLSRVCKAFYKVITDPEKNAELWKTVCQYSDIPIPSQVFYGGSYRDVVQAHLRILQQHYDAAVVQSNYRHPSMACGIRGRPRSKLGQHPPAPQGFTEFIGLHEREQERICQQAKLLLDFLRSFNAYKLDYQNPAWALSSLKRYIMFLSLRKKYPHLLLLPTADILYASLCHLFRTKEYYKDMQELNLSNRNLLELTNAEQTLYIQTALATENLWKLEYQCDYLPAGMKIDWVYWKPDDQYHFSFSKSGPDYFAPPAYIGAIGPLPPLNWAGDVKVTLVYSDLIDDFQWLPELERQFGMMHSQAYNWGLWNTSEGGVIKRLILSYQRFLYLVRKFSEESSELAPPVSIDLMWHAHMTLPSYLEDTTRILGFPLQHQPWKKAKTLLPVEPESTLACLWKQEFSTDIASDHVFQTEKNLSFYS